MSFSAGSVHVWMAASSVLNRNTTGMCASRGFVSSSSFTHVATESLLPVPVMHVASIVPSSCSWLEGTRTTGDCLGVSSANIDQLRKSESIECGKLATSSIHYFISDTTSAHNTCNISQHHYKTQSAMFILRLKKGG